MTLPSEEKLDALWRRLRTGAESMGARYVGAADLSSLAGRDLLPWSRTFEGSTGAVSVGIRLADEVIDLLPLHGNGEAGIRYREHWAAVNARLDTITDTLARLLREEGFSAHAVKASAIEDPRLLVGAFSHKAAARQAGLGWIGRSALLVTPGDGPRVRWATVLTEASLPPSGEPLGDGCGPCRACVEICPVGAFTGSPFDPGEPLEARFRAGRCKGYHEALASGKNRPLCGLCVYACPYGRSDRRVHHEKKTGARRPPSCRNGKG